MTTSILKEISESVAREHEAMLVASDPPVVTQADILEKAANEGRELTPEELEQLADLGESDPQALQIVRNVPFDGTRIIGPRMRALREWKGLAYVELAKQIGLNKSTLGRFEHVLEMAANHPAWSYFERFYRVPKEEFLDGAVITELSKRAVITIKNRLGKKFPDAYKRGGMQPGTKLKEKLGKQYSMTPAAIASRKYAALKREREGRVKSDPTLSSTKMDIEELRVLVQTFNIQRMKGEKIISMPIDVFQVLLAGLLQSNGLNPMEVLVTRDFAETFHK